VRRALGPAIAVSFVLIASGCSGAPGQPNQAPRSSALASPAIASLSPRRPDASPTSVAPPSRRSLPATSTSVAPTSTSTVPSTPPTTAPPPSLPVPAALTPLVAPPWPGEGAWQPASGSVAAGGYSVYTTQLRPAAGYPPAGIAWIDPEAARFALYAGTSEPSGTWPQQGYVSAAQQPDLIAAFNAGFKIYANQTGWYDQGRTAMPLQAGAASLVIFDNGSATIGAWGRDVTPSPTIEAVRQNLSLLVDDAMPAADVGQVGAWGATLGGVTQTWRSAIGITGSGDLVYVGGPLLDPPLLARLLIAAGAVRAMELDINPEWVSFATYTHTGGTISGASSLLPGMYFSPSHYLQPGERDFIAVFSR
jgi:hypothetical protein